MTTLDRLNSEYPLGYSDAEHERLIRQAVRLEPVTEQFFRDAGIAAGQRVLDLGSGVGDVAMLAARMVGASGTVVGIERDAGSLARARARAADGGFRNIEFVQCDIAQYSTDTLFDAVVGRCVLQFLPDPVDTVRSLAKFVRSGGIVLMQEGSWNPFLALSGQLPLWSASVSLMRDAAIRAGVNLEMGPALHRVFREAGLPPPRMRLVMELDSEPGFTRWASDSIRSLYPKIQKLGFSADTIGDLDSLEQRLHDEVVSSNTVVPWIALVGAWCRKP